MIAITGNWFCKKCKNKMNILYINEDDIGDFTRNSERYCGHCLPTNEINSLKEIPLYNENRELI